jgi:hypothetical protein
MEIYTINWNDLDVKITNLNDLFDTSKLKSIIVINIKFKGPIHN